MIGMRRHREVDESSVQDWASFNKGQNGKSRIMTMVEDNRKTERRRISAGGGIEKRKRKNGRRLDLSLLARHVTASITESSCPGEC